MYEENRVALRRPVRWRLLPVALLSGAGGAYLGYRVAPAGDGAQSAAILTLTDGLLRHTSFSTAAPIVATGIAAGSAILAAVAIPVAVLWTLSKIERNKE